MHKNLYLTKERQTLECLLGSLCLVRGRKFLVCTTVLPKLDCRDSAVGRQATVSALSVSGSLVSGEVHVAI